MNRRRGFLWAYNERRTWRIRSFMNFWDFFFTASIRCYTLNMYLFYDMIFLKRYRILFTFTWTWCSFLQYLSFFDDFFRVRYWVNLWLLRISRVCLTNWARTMEWSHQEFRPPVESPDRWLQPKYCPDFVYHESWICVVPQGSWSSVSSPQQRRQLCYHSRKLS